MSSAAAVIAVASGSRRRWRGGRVDAAARAAAARDRNAAGERERLDVFSVRRALLRPLLPHAVGRDGARARGPPRRDQTSRCLHGAISLCAAWGGRVSEHAVDVLAKFGDIPTRRSVTAQVALRVGALRTLFANGCGCLYGRDRRAGAAYANDRCVNCGSDGPAPADATDGEAACRFNSFCLGCADARSDRACRGVAAVAPEPDDPDAAAAGRAAAWRLNNAERHNVYFRAVAAALPLVKFVTWDRDNVAKHALSRAPERETRRFPRRRTAGGARGPSGVGPLAAPSVLAASDRRRRPWTARGALGPPTAPSVLAASDRSRRPRS